MNASSFSRPPSATDLTFVNGVVCMLCTCRWILIGYIVPCTSVELNCYRYRVSITAHISAHTNDFYDTRVTTDVLRGFDGK